MNSTVGPGRVQSLFLFGVVAQLAERYLCKVKDVGSNPICSTMCCSLEKGVVKKSDIT